VSLLSFNLNYYAKEGDVIFIDEPEISLHPDSQRILVRYLAELSKAGLKFVIITHSDYIVKELNNLICITKLISDNKNILNHYYNEKNALDYSMATVYSIYEDKDKIIVKNADEGEYGFEEKLFTRAINNISQDSSQIFSLLEDSFNDKININLEDLYE
jgi:ABC-type multidrug transport system ATPase subunit